MCGIAGLIHRGKSSNVGEELQNMLQALKHRGPDSTGYALYANNDGQNFILRFKVGENVGEGSTSVNEDESVYNERKKIVDKKLSELGAPIVKEEKLTPYSYRYEIKYDKDLMEFSKAVESIENVEILSNLLEKQKVMYTRLSLSDDPKAVEMKENLRKSVAMMGFPPETDMSMLFNSMNATIEALKNYIDS